MILAYTRHINIQNWVFHF